MPDPGARAQGLKHCISAMFLPSPFCLLHAAKIAGTAKATVLLLLTALIKAQDSRSRRPLRPWGVPARPLQTLVFLAAAGALGLTDPRWGVAVAPQTTPRQNGLSPTSAHGRPLLRAARGAEGRLSAAAGCSWPAVAVDGKRACARLVIAVAGPMARPWIAAATLTGRSAKPLELQWQPSRGTLLAAAQGLVLLSSRPAAGRCWLCPLRLEQGEKETATGKTLSPRRPCPPGGWPYPAAWGSHGAYPAEFGPSDNPAAWSTSSLLRIGLKQVEVFAGASRITRTSAAFGAVIVGLGGGAPENPERSWFWAFVSS